MNKREKRLASQRKHYANNKEKVKERVKKYQQTSDKFKKQRKEYERSPKRKKGRIQYQQNRIARMRAVIINHYTKNKVVCQCPKCDIGGFDFMCIDHVNNDGSKERKSKCYPTMLLDIIKNGFPKNYQILCYNCNHTKGFLGKCAHYR